MWIALIVMAAIFGVLMVATIASSRDQLAVGIRGAVRYGVLGTAMLLPLAAVLVLFGLCVYAVVGGILYVLDMVK